MQQQQNASRFAIQTPTSSWRAGSKPAVASTPVRPASNFHAPGNEEAWTQYDGLGPINGGRDLNRNWRNTGSATGNGNGRSAQNGAQTSTYTPQVRGQPRSQFQAPPPKRGGRHGPTKGGDRNRSPQRGGGVQKQRERSPSKLSATRELIDENYLERNFQPLDKEEYKMAPNTLFVNPKGFLWDFNGMSAKSSFLSVRGGHFRCTVILTLPNRQKIEAIGESENKVRSPWEHLQVV